MTPGEFITTIKFGDDTEVTLLNDGELSIHTPDEGGMLNSDRLRLIALLQEAERVAVVEPA